MITLTDNGKVILAYLQAHDQTYVGKDLIDLTGVKGVYSVLNSLMNKGLIQSEKPISREFINNKGEKQLKEYKTYQLTDYGRSFVL